MPLSPAITINVLSSSPAASRIEKEFSQPHGQIVLFHNNNPVYQFLPPSCRAKKQELLHPLLTFLI